MSTLPATQLTPTSPQPLPSGIDLAHPERTVTTRYLHGEAPTFPGPTSPVSQTQLTVLDGWARSGSPQVLLSDKKDWPSHWPQARIGTAEGSLDPLNCPDPSTGVPYAADLVAHLGARVIKAGRATIEQALYFGVSTGCTGTMAALQAATDRGRLDGRVLRGISSLRDHHPGIGTWCSSAPEPHDWLLPHARSVIDRQDFFSRIGLPRCLPGTDGVERVVEATYLALVLYLRRNLPGGGLHLNEPLGMRSLLAERAAWRPELPTPVTCATESVIDWLDDQLPGSRAMGMGPSADPGDIRRIMHAAGMSETTDPLDAPDPGASGPMSCRTAVYLNGHGLLIGSPGRSAGRATGWQH